MLTPTQQIFFEYFLCVIPTDERLRLSLKNVDAIRSQHENAQTTEDIHYRLSSYQPISITTNAETSSAYSNTPQVRDTRTKLLATLASEEVPTEPVPAAPVPALEVS